MWKAKAEAERTGVPWSPEDTQVFKNDFFAEMCSGSEAGSCLRRTDLSFSQL